MFGGAFMRPEWGKDGSGQSPSERLFKLRLKATSAFTTSYYPRAFSGRFEAELRCTDTGPLTRRRKFMTLWFQRRERLATVQSPEATAELGTSAKVPVQ